ncbi:Bug family tripartite tricarboxylate transporter substrate binding protein [Muricoccus radiodurans]|uniref:Bug family tripartite tricarboxylate transporter substrate binding protein n=1 Tax=Muricoccus radiodurans TaxID=2231721 RepID=UPI003CF5642A
MPPRAFRPLPALTRRVWLGAAAGTVAATGPADAQGYPTRPVRLVIPYPAGGSTDLLGRLTGTKLSERLGQPVVVENRAGGGTLVGAEVVMRSPPDGHTLFYITSAFVTSFLINRPGVNLVDAFAPVSLGLSGSIFVVAHPSLPVRTIPELIAHAKANPGRLNVAHPGVATTNHLSAELFYRMAEVDMVSVPFPGNAACLTSLMRGDVQLAFVSIPDAQPFLADGTLRAIAVTGRRRSGALPDTPTIGETLPGYEASFWYGIAAPAGTPPAILQRLNRELDDIARLPEVRDRILSIGAEPEGGEAEALSRRIASEAEQWARVIRLLNL